jgi:hypothetical protein
MSLLGNEAVQFTSRPEISSDTLWHDCTSELVMFAHSILLSRETTGSQVQLVDGHEYLGVDHGAPASLLNNELYTLDLSVGSTEKAIHMLVCYRPSAASAPRTIVMKRATVGIV